ncbi:GAF domain-containing protein, partial [Cryobacterium frigoriphilum]
MTAPTAPAPAVPTVPAVRGLSDRAGAELEVPAPAVAPSEALGGVASLREGAVPELAVPVPVLVHPVLAGPAGPEAARQRAVDELGLVDTPPEDRFDRVTQLARRLFGVQIAAVTLIDHDRQWFKSCTGADVTEADRSTAFCSVTITQSRALVIRDTREDARFRENPLVTGDPGIRFYAGYPLEAHGERVGTLCLLDSRPREFSAAEEELLRDLAFWVQKELTVTQELDRAAEVQRGLLPKRLVSLPGFDVAGGCAPARAVGGDFFDWYPVGEGAAFTLADVMGKGVGAAIIAATVRAVLRSGSRLADIGDVLAVAAATLEEDLDEAASFVTLFHARLDMDSGLLRYVDAGHGLSIVVRAGGGVERLTSLDPPLGFELDAPWQEQSVTLGYGDTLVSVSDGVLDLFDGSLAALAEVAAFVRSVEARAGSSFAQAIVDELMRLAAGGAAADDVTALVVHRIDRRARSAG